MQTDSMIFDNGGEYKMRLIKFETVNCTPCKMVDSLLNSKNIKPEVLEVTENMEYAESLGVSSVPVLILFDDNDKEVSRVLGFKPAEIDKLISQL